MQVELDCNEVCDTERFVCCFGNLGRTGGDSTAAAELRFSRIGIHVVDNGTVELPMDMVVTAPDSGAFQCRFFGPRQHKSLNRHFRTISWWSTHTCAPRKHGEISLAT